MSVAYFRTLKGERCMIPALEILVVPAQLTKQAPFYTGVDQIWFDGVVDWKIRRRVMLSLLALGVGEEQCPTIGEWVALSLAGGVIAGVTGRQIKFPMGISSENLEERTWELLWQFVGDDTETGLSREFRAAILRGCLPRFDHSPPDRPYLRTEFVTDWVYDPPAYPFMSSVGKLTKKGQSWASEKSLAHLSPEVVADIKRIAPYVRASTDYAIVCIRERYRW
ncbi:MAG: hypothetical protein UZ21_OP11001000326 [Microgenomates bacterium OLB22]|nr:MAG: hypothetical protein UZ21_OP11001000326 [Microgenomates bacterium OLB22]